MSIIVPASIRLQIDDCYQSGAVKEYIRSTNVLLQITSACLSERNARLPRTTPSCLSLRTVTPVQRACRSVPRLPSLVFCCDRLFICPFVIYSLLLNNFFTHTCILHGLRPKVSLVYHYFAWLLLLATATATVLYEHTIIASV